MLLKGLPLLVFAIFIDLLQIGLSLSLFGITASIVWIPIFGQASVLIGFLLGITINTSLSLTAGAGHTFATYMTYSTGSSRLKTRIQAIILRRTVIVFFGEIIPVLNNMPWWTISTLVTMRAMRKAEQQATEEAVEAPETPTRTTIQINDVRPASPANSNKRTYASAA